MRKSDITQYFKENFPSIYYSHDLPAKREAWNNYKDMLCKDGQITEKQYNTWVHPAWVNKVQKRRVFEIQQYLFGVWETVTYEYTKKEAYQTQKDYRDNQNYPVRIKPTFE